MSKRLQKSKKYLIKKLSKVIYTGRYSMNYAYLWFMYEDGDVDAQRIISHLLTLYPKGTGIFTICNNFIKENFPR